MILSYWFRLAWLGLACFFLIHLTLGLAISLLSPTAIRIAARFTPRTAARLLFALRLFPLAFSIFLVAALCIPSYLWLEPNAAQEQVGWGFLVAGLLAIAIWLISLCRSASATVRSLRYIRRCLSVGHETHLAGESGHAWVIEGNAPFLALAGAFRPRLLISRGVLNTLSDQQLAAALRHEDAHRTSRDNFRRLLIGLAPGIFPFFRGFDAIERGWTRFTEWAADEKAVAGDPRRAIALADALVRVARVGSAARASLLVAPLLADCSELQIRVDRLLSPIPPAGISERWIALATFGATATLASILLQPWLLRIAYRFLENLIH
jgi:Zn-dependent protease with chaperone function